MQSKNRGVGIGTANTTYTKVPIKGDVMEQNVLLLLTTILVESITVSNGGSGYSFGTVDTVAGGLPTGTTSPVFDVIVPHKGDMVQISIENLGHLEFWLLKMKTIPRSKHITGNQISKMGWTKSKCIWNFDSFNKVKGKCSWWSVLVLDIATYQQFCHYQAIELDQLPLQELFLMIRLQAF